MYNARKYRTSSIKKGDQIYSLFSKEDVVFGTYKGGGVRFGTLIGTVDEYFNLDFIYQEVRSDNRMISGKGFVQPTKRNPKILNLFKTSSLRVKRKTRFQLHPL